jgi:hypothetical protein
MQLNIHYARGAHILRMSSSHFTNSTQQLGEKKQLPCVGHTNIRRYPTKFIVSDQLAPCMFNPAWHMNRVSVNRLFPEHHMDVCSTYTVIITCVRFSSATKLVLDYPSLFVLRSIHDPTFFPHFHCDIQQVCESILHRITI